MRNNPYGGRTPGMNPCMEAAYQQMSMPPVLGSDYMAQQTCAAGTVPYMVEEGDTLYSIARLYSTTVAEILAANPGLGEALYIGQVICVPAGTTAPGTPGMPGTCSGQMYTIRAGDTLYSLARRFGTTVEAIMAANPGIMPDSLRVAQIICIPAPVPVTCPAGSTTYTIVAGDTLYSLARRYGTDVDSIIVANPGIMPDALRIGQVICIPSGAPLTCPPDATLYQIRAGDTIYSLARRFGTTVDAILAANPGIRPEALRVGQFVCIPAAAPVTCPPGSTSYTIVAGDTLYSLARRFGTTVEAITAVNPGIIPEMLRIGQVICIPGAGTPMPVPTPMPMPTPTPMPTTCPPGSSTYMVQAGDTYYSIARRYGLTAAELMAANPTVPANGLMIGMQLCVPVPEARPCPTGSMSYTVQAGDTLTSIMERFSVSVFALTLANPGFNAASLTPGTRLCIAPQACTPPCVEGERYTIAAGEDLAAVASKHNMTTDD